MTDYVAAMKTGLRVLTAITDRGNPASDDVEELRRIAPEFSDLSINDLAFEIILRSAARADSQILWEHPPAAQCGLGSLREWAALHG